MTSITRARRNSLRANITAWDREAQAAHDLAEVYGNAHPTQVTHAMSDLEAEETRVQNALVFARHEAARNAEIFALGRRALAHRELERLDAE